MSSSKAEQFAAALEEAFNTPLVPDPPAAPTTPSGPRKPAPVPEVGRGGTAPGVREAEAQYDFAQTVTRAFNINRL